MLWQKGPAFIIITHLILSLITGMFMKMAVIYMVSASAVWGLFHSILASHGFKRQVKRLAGEFAFNRFYRFAYNLFSLASFFPILLMTAAFPDRALYVIPSPWVYLTTAVQGLSAFALIAAVMQTDALDFAGLAQLSPAYDFGQPRSLVVHGLYAHVRHPIYTAGLVFIWLSAEMTFNRLVLWLVLSVYMLVGALFEEKKLAVDFGAEYDAYKSITPMLIPSWRKKS